MRKKPAPKEVKPCSHRAVSATRVSLPGDEAETYEGCGVGELWKESGLLAKENMPNDERKGSTLRWNGGNGV